MKSRLSKRVLSVVRGRNQGGSLGVMMLQHLVPQSVTGPGFTGQSKYCFRTRVSSTEQC